MSTWLRTLWDGALLRNAVFADLRERGDAFWRGLLIIVVVSLFIHLPTLVGDVSTGLQNRPLVVETDQAMSEMEQAIQQFRPFFGDMSDEEIASFLAGIKESMHVSLEIANKIEALPTYLPKPVDRTFRAVGKWLSQPFAGGGFPLAAASVGAWLGYGIWVMLCAKLLGGRGSLAGFFGATALYVVPHMLRFLAFVSVVGAVLGVIAYLWGAVIYVKATAVSHQISVERALLAVLLPALVALLLVILAATALATLIAIALSGVQ
ncbi:MAG: YIP1 family protein [Anaerolineae bacterium]|nr:YIP1 family protein [Anaerolineae bacterium]